MCKIPSEKGQQDFIELYRTMGATAVKVSYLYVCISFLRVCQSHVANYGLKNTVVANNLFPRSFAYETPRILCLLSLTLLT